ncbi:restriction endonuclease subunit S [Hydrogenophaga sp. BPS33]|uniref:restriction endonuclease subunit S n=1 Tax=Hydrogenophaga sp. BPS33 TaxID=2651974 RepID=UPI00131FF9A2|nr:restriction endonuclease subunit S [Hydrogenophaga sp. BPS33]QHE86853.1 restriction endonuclease subunit S [Hydrogenophaga sp. BPS33]
MSFETKLLAELAAPTKNAIVGGPFGSNLVSKDYAERGVPVIRGQNMGGRWVGGEFVYVSPSKAEALGANKARPGDLVFTQRGTLGQVALVPRNPFAEYIVSQSQMKVTVDPTKADVEYLYYVFCSQDQLDYIRSTSIQTGVPHTNLGILKKTPVPVPPLSIQKQIAAILGSLDDRITLLRETNATLEAIAQALFKSWFVDFDPVRAKVEGRVPEGMDEATAALFPEEFGTSELGMLPKGWRVTTVGDSFILTMGQSPPGDTYNNEGDGLPFYQGRTDFGFRFPTKRVFCNAPTRIAEEGDTLVSVRAPVGDVNMAIERSCIGRGVSSLRHPNGYRSFTFYAVRGLGERFKTFDSEGTVFGSINKKDFQSLPVVDPGEELLCAYEDLSHPIDQRIVENEEQCRTLATLRDTLLPRLISGQLRPPEAQALVEATAQ